MTLLRRWAPLLLVLFALTAAALAFVALRGADESSLRPYLAEMQAERARSAEAGARAQASGDLDALRHVILEAGTAQSAILVAMRESTNDPAIHAAIDETLQLLSNRIAQLEGSPSPEFVELATIVATGNASVTRLKAYLETRIESGQSTHRWTLAVLGVAGGLFGTLGFVALASRARRARALAGASESRYRRVVEHASNAMAVSNASNSRLTLWNAAFETLTGYSKREIATMFPAGLIPERPEGGPEDPEPRSKLDTAAPDHDSYRAFLRARDGNAVAVLVSTTALLDHGKHVGTLIELVDLREQLAMQQRLIGAQKREALGTLVTGIAHSFNDLLGAIIGNVDMARREHGNSRWLANATVAGERATKLVRQLLEFSHPAEPRRTSVDLAILADESVFVARETFDRRVQLAIDVPDDRVMALVDRAQISQVLLNLLLNSRDAVLAQAELLDCPNDDCAEHYVPRIDVTVRPLPDRQGEVEVSVSDNGTGIDAAVLDRVFDPFFTTKDFGAGTGLGLSSARGIVLEHGGDISIESTAGQWTSVRVRLPAASEDAEGTEGTEDTATDSGREVADIGSGPPA